MKKVQTIGPWMLYFLTGKQINKQQNKTPQAFSKANTKNIISLYYDCQIYISNQKSLCQHEII